MGEILFAREPMLAEDRMRLCHWSESLLCFLHRFDDVGRVTAALSGR